MLLRSEPHPEFLFNRSSVFLKLLYLGEDFRSMTYHLAVDAGSDYATDDAAYSCSTIEPYCIRIIYS